MADEFTKLKLNQLEIARSTNVLLYYRERAVHALGKKLRTEVARLFVSTEVKDCMKVLTRINNENFDGTLIDLAIVEFDASSAKLIDYLNKRPLMAETSNCPLIPVIVLVADETKMNDTKEQLMSVGGVNKIVQLNAPSKEILMAIMDVVYNRKRVEDTFRSIKKVRLISSKYPYLPVFGVKSSPPKNKETGIDAGKSGSTSLTGVDFKLDEIEDISECPSLLPEFLSPARRSTLPWLKTRDPSTLPDDFDLNGPTEDRNGNFVPQSMTQFQDESFRSDIPDDIDSFGEKLDIPLPSTVHSNSFLARADSQGTIDDETKTKATDKSKSTTSSSRRAPIKSQAIKLMNPHCRPWWSGSLSTDPIGKTNGANIKYEIHPFVERDQPTLARPSTVSGLDKLSVSRYWHQLNNIGTIKKSEEKPISSSKFKSADPSFPQIGLEASLQPSDQNHKVSAPTSPRSMVHSSSVNGSTRRPSTSGIHSVPSEDGSREYSAFLKVTKQIAQIAKSSAVDFQLNCLMDVDFSHRRINQGEKDMLTRAANLEKDGDVESAIVCYKRAGIHSKDKQLSKLLLGNLSFRQEKFLAALGYYDYALKILLSKAVKVPHDEFLAYYNRSIIHFRLGNDEEGVKDIEKAVSINPSSIEAREILAIARRRTGKYLQAVDEAAMLKIQRQEKERMERIQSQQTATTADESIFSSRDGSPQRGRRSDISIRAAASKKQGVSFEQSQLSSKIDSGPSVTTYGANSYALQGFQAQQSQRVFNPAYGGVQVRIDEPTARTSFLEKIVDHRKANKSEDAGHEDGGGALKIFKMNNGYELELFDDLFKKPSSLQYALITPPSDRTIDQHNIIRDTLKTFPFLRKMSPSSIQELAGVVEYRALTGKGELFVQNEESAVTCLLLNGHVQVKMDASYGSTMMDVILGELKANSSFAYIDLLFRKPRPQLRSALEEALFPHFVKQSKQITNITSTNVEQEAESADEKSVNSADTEEEGDLAKFSKEFEEFWQATPQSRSIAPGMFMTYTMQSACEFLMVPEHEYNRVMMNHALEELKARIGALISCGIFKDWHVEDLIRLARMSQIKFYNGGETILQQGAKPSGIGIVMKGLCKVIKKPNRTEMLYQKLNVALEKADQYDLKYVYHHGVSKGMLVSKTSTDKRTKSNKSRAKSPVQKSKHHHTQRQDPISALKNFPTNVYCEPMPATEPETFRKELQAEIEKLQQLIQKAKLQDAMDWREDRTTNTHAKSSNTYDLVKSDHPSKVNELAGYLSGSISEIATLQWPMLFGEACILDPENGISRGSVVADTACEILVLHKVQIQTFPVDADFLDRVRGKAIAYPHDPDLVVNLYRDIEWKHYKEEMMQGISTTRWPKKFDTHEPFII